MQTNKLKQAIKLLNKKICMKVLRAMEMNL